MKKFAAFAMVLILCLGLVSCKDEKPTENTENFENIYPEATAITLGKEITVDGKPIEESEEVTLGGEIIYYHDMDEYESGNPYGEGEKEDKHTEKEVSSHSLVTITKPGEYIISGEMKGQLAIDLGEGAENDPAAKVTLILNNADITCEVAPAVIFYNVYECADPNKATQEVNTESAGANIIIADKSENNIKGSYVAKIFKDNEEQKKLHKYDAAFYSKMSMNIFCGENGDGILNIEAENEGLDTEMHLTINGGHININADNDGINTNEDGISVTTINGGTVNIKGGLGSEGDGIDSNGWLVINGGILVASGHGRNGDGGIDADKDIVLNGGVVAAFGSRNDDITLGENQTAVQLTFASTQKGGSSVKFVDEGGYGMMYEADRDFGSVVFAGENLEKNKEYFLYVNGVLQEYSGNESSWPTGSPDMTGKETPENFEKPDETKTPDAINPFNTPKGFEEWLENANDIPVEIRIWLEGFVREEPKNENENPQRTEENRGTAGFVGLEPTKEDMTVFVITDKVYTFSGIYDASKVTGKENVEFEINGGMRIEDLYIGTLPEIKSVTPGGEIPENQIEIILEYIGNDPSLSLLRSCMLSEGYDEVNRLFKDLKPGEYCFTAAVTAENKNYTGSTSFNFDVLD